MESEPGAYTVRDDGITRIVTGLCAKCERPVCADQASVVMHSLWGERGGIFHDGCKPNGWQWYRIMDEAPDV